MHNSKHKLFTLLLVVGLFISFTVSGQSESSDKLRKHKNREMYMPVPPVPPVPTIPSIPSIPSIPAFEFSLPSLPELPQLPEVPELPDFVGFDSFSVNDDHFVLSDSESGLRIESDGNIQFNDDFSEIESISNGGFISIKDQKLRKEVLIERDTENNEVVYSFYKRGKLLSFKGEGDEWLKSVWPKLIKIYR